jgi:hypothetical protein
MGQVGCRDQTGPPGYGTSTSSLWSSQASWSASNPIKEDQKAWLIFLGASLPSPSPILPQTSIFNFLSSVYWTKHISLVSVLVRDSGKKEKTAATVEIAMFSECSLCAEHRTKHCLYKNALVLTMAQVMSVYSVPTSQVSWPSLREIAICTRLES